MKKTDRFRLILLALLFSAWSEGAVLNKYEDFASYVEQAKKEFNSPVKSQFYPTEVK